MLDDDTFALLTKQEYFQDLAARVAATQPGDRLLVVTHDFHPEEPLVDSVVQAVVGAAQRGVETHFALDERAFPVLQRVPLNRRTQQLLHTTRHALRTLEAAGTTFAITNKTFQRVINRFSGRAHIKLAVVNDTVYVGGCNLTHEEQIDMMVRWQDRAAADWLYSLMCQVIQKESTQAALRGRDRTFAMDSHTTLLLDSGKPHQSIIFDNALQLIDEAKEWLVITCQYFPNSTTAEHLTAAIQRGVDVQIYYNHPSSHAPGFKLLMHAAMPYERLHRHKAMFAKQLPKGLPYLHAKLLASEQAAMIGSHNYVVYGVQWGTAELSLLRKDPAFAARAVQQFREQITTARHATNRTFSRRAARRESQN